MAATKENPVPGVETGVLPFGIEIDHPRNSDVLLQSAPGVRLRSAIDAMKPVKDRKSGNLMVPVDQSRHLASFPRTRGMVITVDPNKGTYKITDPLRGDKSTCDRIRRYLRENTGTSTDETIDGVPEQNGKLDVHRMKTLCRELITIVENGHGKKVEGPLPTLEDLEEMPGSFLLNPGSRVHNSQPRYEKDFPEWVDNLSRMGG